MRSATSLAGTLLAASCLLACASHPAVPPAAPTAAPPAPVGAPPPAAPDFSAIPPAPAHCDRFLGHRGPHHCAATDDPRVPLAAALSREDPGERDRALSGLLPCPVYPPGVIAALRAELAPSECSDAILAALQMDPSALPDAELRDAILGLGLAAQLERVVRTPPELEPPFDRDRFRAFLNETLSAWIRGQAEVIHSLSARGARLRGYGKGLVAIHAGLADMRFVSVVRDVPLPSELAADPELEDAYYGSLDQALEPRKSRGRDAALVGLRLMAEAGVHEDARVERARQLLSRAYAGRRIDALDALLLPSLPPTAGTGVSASLAARLPTFFVERILAALDSSYLSAGSFVEPSSLDTAQSVLARGLPPRLHAQLDASHLPRRLALAYAEALIRSGRLYWRAADFARATAILGDDRSDPALAAEGALLQGISSALQSSARDAIEMMSRGPFPSTGPDLSALERLSRGRGELAARAGFNAALLRGLSPPPAPEPAFFTDLERRYRDAAERAEQAATRTLCEDRAAAAAATAAAITD